MGAIDHWNEGIVRLRKKAGLKQGEAAEKAGLSPSQLSRYEAGTASPSLRTLGRLLDAYNADLDQLAHAVRESRLDAALEWQKAGLRYLADWRPVTPDLSAYKEIWTKLAEQCQANTVADLQDSITQSLQQLAETMKVVRSLNDFRVELPSIEVELPKLDKNLFSTHQELNAYLRDIQEDIRQSFKEAFACMEEKVVEDDPEPAPSSRSKSVGAGQGHNRRG